MKKVVDETYSYSYSYSLKFVMDETSKEAMKKVVG
jgi:hypothetical protein